MENKKNNQPLDLAVTDPEWTAITTAFAGQEVPAASPLTGKERWLCVLSALLGCQGMGAFRKALGSALDDGVEPVAVREVIYQATAYLGIGRVQDFLLAAGEVMMRHGIALPLPAQGTAGADARFDKGLAKQVALFGEGMAKVQTDGPAAHGGTVSRSHPPGDRRRRGTARGPMTRRTGPSPLTAERFYVIIQNCTAATAAERKRVSI